MCISDIGVRRGGQWSEEGMNTEELQRFLGLTLLMGLVCKPTLEMYCQAIFVTPMFNSIMTSKLVNWCFTPSQPVWLYQGNPS